MALIVLASANGSPGVSTTALGLTLNWHRPMLLVDADPTGSSAVFAGYFRGTQEPTGGLINLALALREGALAAALPRETLLLDPEGPAERAPWFLPGIRAHEQAPSLVALWEPLAEQLRALDRNGQDVIVDAGRLGLAGWPQPLVAASDLTLLVTRSSLPALAGAHSWATMLREQFAAVGGLSRLGLLLVDEDRRWPALPAGVPRVRPYTPRHIAKALQIAITASVGWEPEAAEVYSHGARKPRRFESSDLVRSYRTAASLIHSVLTSNQATFAHPVGGRG
ncbi:hypothetical protein GHK92_15825 [Nocardioides sp. dk4132]|uniref:hypothetical protein n=1 Tax=unclassified Nocardioides TaxID=2615069 RepID=UPI0012968919|nr:MULTISPECIES: hypothetical protein [unclassified Nocardioides]MQW77343.1 hypothetical protein [Nocardioides sp. dk4132]QGA08095.1 hypothetical protein GFH29_12295 [Nocardioides sp. dk884]